jgi:hypothetical protein
MKIYVNDKEVDLKTTTKTSDRSDVDKWFYNNLQRFSKEYDFDKKGYVRLKFKKSLYSMGVFTNQEGKRERKLPTRVKSITLKLEAQMVFNGEEVTVVCAKNRRRDKNGDYVYIGTSLRVDDDMSIYKRNRELALFLYALSPHVQGKGRGSADVILPKQRNIYFEFENVVAEAKNKMEAREQAFRTFEIIKKMGIKDTHRFASTIGISNEDITVLKETLVSSIESNDELFEKLEYFVEHHDKSIYEVENVVLKALEKGLISYKVGVNRSGRDMVYWGYGKPKTHFDKKDVIHAYEGVAADNEVLFQYFVEHPDLFNEFKLKITK